MVVMRAGSRADWVVVKLVDLMAEDWIGKMDGMAMMWAVLRAD